MSGLSSFPDPPRRRHGSPGPARALAAALGRLRDTPAQSARETGLETCPMCGLDFVNPVEWDPVDEQNWWMLLRCGGCETWREVTVANAVAERYDHELDRRLDSLNRTLRRLDRQRMATEVEAIVAALRRGLIDAADFSR